jgi:hypothetical protein
MPRWFTTSLSASRRVFALLFIPLVVFHLGWITPVVEWSCLCPDDQPNHRCCCNCPKCVKNRGGFKSFCHLRPETVENAEIARGSSVIDLFATQCNPSPADNPQHFRQISVCECDSHIKKITLDTQPFLPQALICNACSFPLVGAVNLCDYWRPLEAIPCQPDPPG